MTYQGVRARPMGDEKGRRFEVSKVRIGSDGHVSDVLWAEVSAGADREVGARVVATAAEVVDAIHDGAAVAAVFSSSRLAVPEREFVVVEHEDGREYLAFAEAPSPGRNLRDIASLDEDSRTIAFRVNDMTGSRCAGAVTQAVKGIDPSARLRFDLVNFTVEIEPGHATARQLSDAIKRAGYSPVAA